MKKSFTLIELLIVIGILSVLVVTILVTLNPAEAQKKTRDTKRMKDLATLQGIIEQYIAAGNPPTCTEPPLSPFGCDSHGAGPVQSQPCASNWIGVSLCDYTKTVPVDPSNSRSRTFVHSNIQSPGTERYEFRYFFKMRGSDYEINLFMESKSNINNVVNDGGNSPNFVEAGSDLTIIPNIL